MNILKEAYKICLEESEELETLFRKNQDKVNAMSTEIMGLRRELKNVKIPLSTNAEKITRRSLRTLYKKNVGKYKMKLGSEFDF
jgi:Skp family chaperone for outer membrane proteins